MIHIQAFSLLVVGLQVGCVVGEVSPGSGSKSIVNPTDSDDHTHVQVGIVSSSGSLCSGTVISPYIVVTAAHCFPNGPGIAFESELYGELFVTSIVDTVLHPGFTDVGPDDLALVLLQDPAPFAPAPFDASLVLTHTPVTAVGFGVTSADDTDVGTRRSGTMITDSVDDMIHTVPDSSSVCSGDSGGALLDGDRLIGVTSATDEGCLGRGHFVRIDSHYEYIQYMVATWTGV